MIGAVALGSPSLRLRPLAPRARRPGPLAVIPLPESVAGRAWIGDPRGELRAVPDGNRSAIVDGARVVFVGREWLVGIKGVGAAAPLYGASPIDDVFGHDFDPGAAGTLPARTIAGESWMGESPYGAQGEVDAAQGLAITALASEDGTIEGARICPIACVLELPDEAVHRDVFWYRRHRGAFLQEIRLLPSDVRLFHSSDRALSRDPEAVLEGLGIHDAGALDAFVDRYLATGIAALTLWARTARPCPGGHEGLDLHDAWLDKDCVVGADGALFLADLESIEWTPTTHRIGAEARVRGQIDRNSYELLYGLDAMLDVRDRWLDRPSTAHARRASVGARLALALAGDPVVRAIEHEDGVDLEVRARGDALAAPVRVRFLDRR